MNIIAMAGHTDAAKIATTEHILFHTGVLRKMGVAYEATAMMDWMEQERGITSRLASTPPPRLHSGLSYSNMRDDIAAAYQRLLEAVLVVPPKLTSALHRLTGGDERQSLARGNETETNNIGVRYVRRRFERHAEHINERRNVLLPTGKHNSYCELNLRASRLAQRLLNLGRGPDEGVVLVVAEHSPRITARVPAKLKAHPIGQYHRTLGASVPREPRVSWGELTADRIVSDVLGKMLRSGDLRRFPWDSDGEYFGRPRLAEEEHVSPMTMHHIVSDVCSLGVLVYEVAALRECLAERAAAPLREPPIQFADYAARQRDLRQGESLEEQSAYWKQRLRSLPLLDPPTDRPCSFAPTFRGTPPSFIIAAALRKALFEPGITRGLTLYMTQPTAFQSLIHRHTSRHDLSAGSPVATRSRAGTETLACFLVDTFAMRTDPSGDTTFRDSVRRVRKICLDAYARKHVSFEQLVKRALAEGSVYLPLDPSYPRERFSLTARDSRIKVLLTRKCPSGLGDELGRHGCKTPDLDGAYQSDDDARAGPRTSAKVLNEYATAETAGSVVPVSNVSPLQAVYVIYTLGSSGRPKGIVVVNHQKAVNRVAACHSFRRNPIAGALQPSSKIDASLLNSFRTPCPGGTPLVSREGWQTDPSHVLRLADEERTVALFVGEVSSSGLIGRRHTRARCAVFNDEYGPMEAFCLIPDSFAAQPDARLYRTGEVARRASGGKFEYVGRRKLKVKLRRLRVEAGAGKVALIKHAGADEPPSARMLGAYYAIADDRPPSATGMPELLKAYRPEYMIPEAFKTKLPPCELFEPLKGAPIGYHSRRSKGRVYRQSSPLAEKMSRRSRAHGHGGLPFQDVSLLQHPSEMCSYSGPDVAPSKYQQLIR
jgi:non-ribosomal peptide synthetase component F